MGVLMRLLLVTLFFLSQLSHAGVLVIGGTDAVASDYEFVVELKLKSIACTGTVIGSHVVMTAAHCLPSAVFSGPIWINNIQFKGRGKRSALYPMQEHDIAVVVTDQPMNRRPAVVGTRLNERDQVELLGYGCSDFGGKGAHGILRRGVGEVVRLDPFVAMVRGAALCFGDSGAPAILTHGHFPTVVGVGSHGNTRDVSYLVRTDIAETGQFLEKIATEFEVDICGLNVPCD